MKRACLTIILICILQVLWAQNSILVNFGSPSCVAFNQPAFSLIKNPLGATPSIVAQCTLTGQLPNFFAVFVAYNPRDNNLYIADVRTFTQSRIWKLDVGLPDSITCPASIPVTPVFTHNYVSNNFEFDNSGDLWSFASYDAANGRCFLDRFDVVTGNIINRRVIQFPDGNFPTAITSGDLCILPNGRMFATLGDYPSRLYEIPDYTAPNSTVQARFLQLMPKNCYGIAYLNGLLEITGTDLSTSCYYFTYDFANNILGSEKPFQNGQAPIDNTSISPSIGATKRLVSATKVDATTADIIYEVHVRNMGNTQLNDVNITEDLDAVFGAANLQTIEVSFAPGGNAAGLTLNPGFNGSTDKHILQPDQSLPNFTGANTDYFVTVQLKLRVKNLQSHKVYLNSGVATATINSLVDKIILSDSSNNGLPSVMDPNQNGNPTETGENVPTPFDFSLLPVQFTGFEGRLLSPVSSELRWQIAVPATGADFFEIQYSTDAANWTKAGVSGIRNAWQKDYRFVHNHNGLLSLFYRIRQVDRDGQFVFSPVIHLQQQQGSAFSIYPNPAKDRITIHRGEGFPDDGRVRMVDQQGRTLLEKPWAGRTITLPLHNLPTGNYRVILYSGSYFQSRQITIIR